MKAGSRLRCAVLLLLVSTGFAVGLWAPDAAAARDRGGRM